MKKINYLHAHQTLVQRFKNEIIEKKRQISPSKFTIEQHTI